MTKNSGFRKRPCAGTENRCFIISFINPASQNELSAVIKFFHSSKPGLPEKLLMMFSL